MLFRIVSEEMARQFARTTGATFAGFCISNITGPPGGGERFPTFQSNSRLRRLNLWGHVDARDVAQACPLSLEADLDGAEVFVVAVADTIMNKGSQDVMQEVYLRVPLREIEGCETLLSIIKASRVVGYSPEHS